MTSLSGRELAAGIRASVAARAAELTAEGQPPGLAVVTATKDEASAWYVRSLTSAAGKAGILCQVLDLLAQPNAAPSQTDSADANPAHADPAEADPVQADPAATGQADATPAQAGSFQADPAATGQAGVAPADVSPAHVSPAHVSPAHVSPAHVSPARIRAVLGRLSTDPSVRGIILQTPLPGGARLADLADAIDPAKDADGANPVSLGRLMAGLPAFAPATAAAVLAMLDHHQVELRGRHAVVVGRSVVVGKPVAQLLLARDATVTICHSRTADLAAITRQADILVVAAGRPGLIRPEHVAPGAIVIDVGTNAAQDGSLVGDVDPSVAQVAGGLSPVPGGVGPVTTATLLAHVVLANTVPANTVVG